METEFLPFAVINGIDLNDLPGRNLIAMEVARINLENSGLILMPEEPRVIPSNPLICGVLAFNITSLSSKTHRFASLEIHTARNGKVCCIVFVSPLTQMERNNKYEKGEFLTPKQLDKKFPFIVKEMK